MVYKGLFKGRKDKMGQNEEMKMTYSSIVVADGKKKVSVKFEDGERFAEGSIPECKITKSAGFQEDELLVLEKYLQMNQMDIIKKAKEISGFRNLFR